MRGHLDLDEQPSGWLPDDELDYVRDRVPTVYVDAIPVRCDHLGRIDRVGLLSSKHPEGLVRAIVSGRVLYGETYREALWRHLTKDLGPDCEPQLPLDAAPLTVAEYFPDPSRTGFHDHRQHAVSLVFTVPLTGEVTTGRDLLGFEWFSIAEVTNPAVMLTIDSGQDKLVAAALARSRQLP